MHMDIIFGPKISVWNVYYGLLFTDCFSQITYLYPLQNLTTDTPKQLEAFFVHIGTIPHRLISDFDLKLIGGNAWEHLNSLLIHVNAVPSYCQDKNGLAECHWQTMVTMACNRLASAELLSRFWFYSICQAAEGTYLFGVLQSACLVCLSQHRSKHWSFFLSFVFLEPPL
jgi:hypothetical protein